MLGEECHIEVLDRYNWEEVLSVSPKPEQLDYVPSVIHCLAEANFENLIPYGIRFKGKMVGFLMYGQFGNICWINRVIVDAQSQGQGCGSAAIRQLIRKLKADRHCAEIRTSHARHNSLAGYFFRNLGFEPLPDALEDEIVLVLTEEDKVN